MKKSNVVLAKIINNFKKQKIAQVQGYNQFKYIRETGSTRIIQRENGSEAKVPFPKLIIAIEGVQKSSTFYNAGSSGLRELGLNHVTSPIWAMLYLIDISQYK